jgi:hypothetical protein
MKFQNLPTCQDGRIPVNKCLKALLAVVLGLDLAQAQAQTKILNTSEIVGNALYTSSREIVMVVPSIRNKAIAEGLRRAAVERNVRIFILADAYQVSEATSYIPSLSLLPGVSVKVLRGIRQTQAIMDSQVLLEGPLLYDISGPLETRNTVADTSPYRARAAAAWFSRNWKKAKIFKYQIPKRQKINK